MRVIFISYDGMTDPLGQSQVLPYLSENSKRGVEFVLISLEKPKNFELFGGKIRQLCKDSNIEWRPLSYTKSPPILSSIWDVFKIKKEIKKVVEVSHVDLLHCRSYIPAIWGVYFKSKNRIPFLFDMRGFWADERIDGGIWRLSNPIHKYLYNYLKRKEKIFLKEAAATVSLTELGKSEMQTWECEINGPIEVIPCCADEQTFSIDNVNMEIVSSFRSKYSVSSTDYLLVYLGSIGTWYMLDEMMRFFSLIKRRNPESKFLFISKDNPEEILSSGKGHGIDPKDLIVRPAERSEIASLLSICDASVFFIKDAFSKKASSPTKMGELMNLGLPIVCNPIGDNGLIMNQVLPSLLVESFDENGLTPVVEQLLNPESDCNSDEVKRRVMEKSKSYFSLSIGAEKFFNIYNFITK